MTKDDIRFIRHLISYTRINSKWMKDFGQDGGIGRNLSLPCVTKRRITTNLKSINNQT